MTGEQNMDAFRHWLRGEMDQRDWNNAKLARELDVFKGTVGRWLQPPPEGEEDDRRNRQPSYENCRKLSELFGVDLHRVLAMAGHDEYDDEGLTPIHKDAQALIPLIPADMIAVVYAQLRSLIDARVQAAIRSHVSGAGEFSIGAARRTVERAHRQSERHLDEDATLDEQERQLQREADGHFGDLDADGGFVVGPYLCRS